MAIDLVALSALANEPTIREMVTIFAYRESWMNDEDYVDWRCGNQLIPARSFVIGLINPKNGMAMVSIPFTSDTQKNQLNEILREVLVRVGVYPFDAPLAADALIEEGYITFSNKNGAIAPYERKVFLLRD